MTVGSRFALDRLSLTREFAGFAAQQLLTAGGEFRPALNRYGKHYSRGGEAGKPWEPTAPHPKRPRLDVVGRNDRFFSEVAEI